MKKELKVILVATIVVAMLWGMLFTAQKVSEIPRYNSDLKGPYTVAWNKVNFREGPGYQYEILKTLEKGERLQANGYFVSPLFSSGVNSEGEYWLQMTTEDGTYGYVLAKTLSKVQRQYNEKWKGEWTIQWEYVNSRETPDEKGEVQRKLPRGAKVIATGNFVDPQGDIPVGGDRPDPGNVWLEIWVNKEKEETEWICSTAIRVTP